MLKCCNQFKLYYKSDRMHSLVSIHEWFSRTKSTLYSTTCKTLINVKCTQLIPLSRDTFCPVIISQDRSCVIARKVHTRLNAKEVADSGSFKTINLSSNCSLIALGFFLCQRSSSMHTQKVNYKALFMR